MPSASSFGSHVWLTLCYYRNNPSEIKKDGGRIGVVSDLRGRIGRKVVREMVAWELGHPVEPPYLIGQTYDWDADIKKFLVESKVVKKRKIKNSGKEVYSSGRLDRAEGVAEFLNKNGRPAKAIKLSDGERTNGRRYIVKARGE